MEPAYRQAGIRKKQIHTKNVKLYYHPREIWWCYLGLNVGCEQDGSEEKFLRPVIIIRDFGPSSCLIIPLTKSTKKHPLRIPIGEVENNKAVAVLSQMKVVDTKRLLEKIGFLNKDNFLTLKKAVRNLF